eukprot:scaffold283577_cov17-Tisochrysis_lutea.AAC.1
MKALVINSKKQTCNTANPHWDSHSLMTWCTSLSKALAARRSKGAETNVTAKMPSAPRKTANDAKCTS